MTAITAARSHGYLEGIGRLRLHYRAWEVPEPRAAVLVVHGLFEHGGRYERFAEAAAGRAISTFALDLRGHGRSHGRRGYVAGFDVFLGDLDRFRAEVVGLYDEPPATLLLGHSLGALIVLRYLQEFAAGVRGAIISSPWLESLVSKPLWKLRTGAILDRVLPALPFAAGFDAADLSREPAVVAAYRSDPLVHSRVTPRLCRQHAAASDILLRRAHRLRVPLLFLLAGRDRLADADRGRELAAAITKADVSTNLFPEHFHELLNDADSTQVLARVWTWIDTVLAQPAAELAAAPGIALAQDVRIAREMGTEGIEPREVNGQDDG